MQFRNLLICFATLNCLSFPPSLLAQVNETILNEIENEAKYQLLAEVRSAIRDYGMCSRFILGRLHQELGIGTRWLLAPPDMLDSAEQRLGIGAVDPSTGWLKRTIIVMTELRFRALDREARSIEERVARLTTYAREQRISTELEKLGKQSAEERLRRLIGIYAVETPADTESQLSALETQVLGSRRAAQVQDHVKEVGMSTEMRLSGLERKGLARDALAIFDNAESIAAKIDRLREVVGTRKSPFRYAAPSHGTLPSKVNSDSDAYKLVWGLGRDDLLGTAMPSPLWEREHKAATAKGQTRVAAALYEILFGKDYEEKSIAFQILAEKNTANMKAGPIKGIVAGMDFIQSGIEWKDFSRRGVQR